MAHSLHPHTYSLPNDFDRQQADITVNHDDNENDNEVSLSFL